MGANVPRETIEHIFGTDDLEFHPRQEFRSIAPRL